MIETLALLPARSRAFLSLALAAVTFLISSYLVHPWSALVLAWIVAAVSWVSLVILMMDHVPAAVTAEWARHRELRSGVTLLVTVVVSLASLGALAYMVVD